MNLPPQRPECDLDRTYHGHLDLACEHLADDLIAARLAHDETRAELRWACDANRVAVGMIRDLALRLDRSRDINRQLRIELTKLRDALVELEERRAA